MHRRQSAQKREHILEATQRVLLRDGIWQATTRKVAEEAGLPLATIHYHFEDKERLLLEVFERLLAPIELDAREMFDVPTTLAERIGRVVQVTWEYCEHHWREQFLQIELTLYSVRTEGATGVAKRQYEGFLDLYVNILRRASDIGARTDLDITGLARQLLAGVDGLLMQHFAEPDPARSRQALRKLVALLLRYPLTEDPDPVTPVDLDSKPRRPQRRRSGGATS
jgi:AcrR family transcriptional regulator